jgi:hypothetical protein
MAVKQAGNTGAMIEEAPGGFKAYRRTHQGKRI